MGSHREGAFERARIGTFAQLEPFVIHAYSHLMTQRNAGPVFLPGVPVPSPPRLRLIPSAGSMLLAPRLSLAVNRTIATIA